MMPDDVFSCSADASAERTAHGGPEEALRRCRSELKGLQEELVRVSEDERKRVAADLHDTVCQELIAIGCTVTALQRKLEKEGHPLAAELETVSKAVSGAATHTRQIAHGLGPLLPGGLMGALQELATAISARGQVCCRFECAPPVVISDPVLTTHLFRVAQEAVHNAARHSGATRIHVSLAETSSGITLAVADDGCGLPPEASRRSGLGLRGMRRRADLIHGYLTIRNRADGGTEIICQVPGTPAAPGDPGDATGESFASAGSPDACGRAAATRTPATLHFSSGRSTADADG